MGERAENEMMQGYIDGGDPDAPEPSDNRSLCYRHGFANARADRAGKPRASAESLRRTAAALIAQEDA